MRNISKALIIISFLFPIAAVAGQEKSEVWKESYSSASGKTERSIHNDSRDTTYTGERAGKNKETRKDGARKKEGTDKERHGYKKKEEKKKHKKEVKKEKRNPEMRDCEKKERPRAGISKEEFLKNRNGRNEATFRKYDKNGDGFLEKEEIIMMERSR